VNATMLAKISGGAIARFARSWLRPLSTLCVKIWTVMSQRVIEWIRNLCLNVFKHKHQMKSIL